MDSDRKRAWHALEIGPLWRLRASLTEGAAAAGHAVPSAPAAHSGPDRTQVLEQTSLETWQALQQAVSGCTACALSGSRRQTVFGTGPQPAPWMIVGEAPGQQEDASGEPFVGQAGQLLDQMLAAIGVNRRAEVFITNVLKCRPPSNRDPLPEEVARCDPYLRRQVELVQPRLILVLGRFAAHSLLGTDASLASLRGLVHPYPVADRAVPLVVTYHPAYLLRQLADKAHSWADLRLARRTFEG